MKETAFAKINLALHVRKRREDGYHELETLFAFVDAGDVLSAKPSGRDELITLGEFADGIDDPFGNIVAKALGVLPHGEGWAVTLEKNLPVAAGLGGGSADAGAIFRMVERAHGLPDDWRERAARLGADVRAERDLHRARHGDGTGADRERSGRYARPARQSAHPSGDGSGFQGVGRGGQGRVAARIDSGDISGRSERS
jgi:4-diphosphocytidyl-2-C-methyl-D-erythritol kinase